MTPPQGSTVLSAATAADGRRSGVHAAGAAAAGIYLGFAGLQVALALGAPLGGHVWGGSQPDVLPSRMRVVSVGAAAVLDSMAAVVSAEAGVGPLRGRSGRWLTPATWGVAGYMALNTAGNLASESPVERRLFAPATAVAAVLTGVVARASS